MPGTFRVENLHDVQAGFANLERETRLGFRAGLRHVAEPVQRGAEQLDVANISRIGPRWSKMRIGITRDMVYVAPRQRGRRGGRGPASRHRSDQLFAERLMTRAMEPALAQHSSEVEARLGELLDREIDKFNRGGI